MASRFKKQISLGYNQDGKRVRVWIRAETQQELKRKERALLRNADSEILSNKTFGAYRKEWYDAYKANKSDATRLLYKYTTGKLSALDQKRLRDITRTDIQNILNDYIDKPTAALRIANTAKQILEAASADNLIPLKNWKFDLPKRKTSEKRALTKAEKKAIRDAKLTPQERLFVDIEFYLGLRPGETRALQPNDFNLKDKTVSITKAVSLSAEPVLKDTKTGKTRTLPVPDVLLAEIRAYNAHFRGFYYFVDEEGELFTRSRYDRFKEGIFAKINEALGGNDKLNVLNGMTFYTFRHNRATDLYYLQGVSMKMKAEYMGHSEMMFLKTYSHLSEDKEAVELLRTVM